MYTLVRALVLLTLATPVYAGRNELKCGRVLATRAEYAHLLSLRIVRAPAGCDRIRLPENYIGRADGIWRVKPAARLVWAVDTAKFPIKDAPVPAQNAVITDKGPTVTMTIIDKRKKH